MPGLKEEIDLKILQKSHASSIYIYIVYMKARLCYIYNMYIDK